MKRKSILFSLLLASTAFILVDCGNKNAESQGEHKDDAAMAEHASGSTAANEASESQFTVDAKFQEQLSEVFKSYVALKDAFVSSNAAGIVTEAATTRKSLGNVDMKLLSGAAHNDWMNYLDGMEGPLKAIESSPDIEAQRKEFSTLSDNLYKSIKAYGLGGQPAYYEFCPMAFDNQGAFWLSEAEAIRNPYFGDKMLTCGSVKEKLK